MRELIEKALALKAAFAAGDYWAIVKIVGELLIAAASIKQQPVMAAWPAECSDLRAAVADLKSLCEAPAPVGADNSAIDPERWEKIKTIVQFAIQILSFFV